MKKIINTISNLIASKNVNFESTASLNFLDIGCSSFIPEHFLKHQKLINYFGCDPDLTGLKKLKEKSYISKFKSSKFQNVGASNQTKIAYLEVEKKRTGSKVVNYKKNNNNLLKINLVKTSDLQKQFNNGNANLIKIDAEGHELEIISGMNLNCEDLLCVEVECTLNQNNSNLSSIFTLFEKNNFFLASLRYHNKQTFITSKFKNKILSLIYKLLIRLPIIGKFNYIWTNLSGASSFSDNKSFIEQIELIFLKNQKYQRKDSQKKFSNLLLIYGFLRYVPNLKVSKLNKFIINNFPSR